MKSQKLKKRIAAGSIEINYPGGIRIIFHEGISSDYLKALVS